MRNLPLIRDTLVAVLLFLSLVGYLQGVKMVEYTTILVMLLLYGIYRTVKQLRIDKNTIHIVDGEGSLIHPMSKVLNVVLIVLILVVMVDTIRFNKLIYNINSETLNKVDLVYCEKTTDSTESGVFRVCEGISKPYSNGGKQDVYEIHSDRKHQVMNIKVKTYKLEGE